MRVVIVGGGQVGSYLAALLLKDGHQLKIVEGREKQLQELRRNLPEGAIVEGNFTDPAVLEKAGIHQADVLVALTSTDEDNLVVSTLARFEFGVKRVIARANEHKNSWLFTKELGVDVGLTEAELMAHFVAEEMASGDLMTLLKLNQGRHSLVQEKVRPDSLLVGKPLSELALPPGCIIAAIIRHDELIAAGGDTVLEIEDEILTFCPASAIPDLALLLGPLK